ncbi:hypothetical protein [Nocardioides pelophilus]|uniref:hypothetical protein n=1 Tax=Nocardioides pelophilus TaxID=2172019 RepID=UPI001603FC38|nr:hypothetical protein [Nocardioides pelophilus]
MSGNLAPGESGTTLGQFVLHDFYTPEAPSGDEELYDYIHLYVPGLGSAGSGEHFTVAEISGPGIEYVDAIGTDAALFPLDGD